MSEDIKQALLAMKDGAPEAWAALTAEYALRHWAFAGFAAACVILFGLALVAVRRWQPEPKTRESDERAFASGFVAMLTLASAAIAVIQCVYASTANLGLLREVLQ